MPAPLRESLPGHEVRTAFELGWATLRNGELLARAEAEFEGFVTTDRNLKNQQNLARFRLAILVLPTTSWPRLQRMLGEIAAAVDALEAGEYRELTLPA